MVHNVNNLKDFYLDFIDIEDLPKNYINIEKENIPVFENLIKTTILSKHGGVWLDLSVVLLKSLEEWCLIDDSDNLKIRFCSNYENWGGSFENGFKGNDILNDWFLASSK